MVEEIKAFRKIIMGQTPEERRHGRAAAVTAFSPL
jgi:hypothetical protein